MSKITVVGLGMMGAALGRTLLAAGNEVTVWNRDNEKARPLAAQGALPADSLAQAIAASPIAVVCVKDYATTHRLFDTDEVITELAGCCIVQLSTGTPKEVRASEQWFQKHNADYLDGAILAAPTDIGGDTAQILCAGKSQLWQQCQPVLQCLAGRLDYTGEKIDSATILDLAWLSQRLGIYMGVFQAILLCQASGIDLDVYGATIAPNERMKLIAGTIKNDSFNKVINTVKVWREALQHVRHQAKDCGVNMETLDFLDDKFQRAQSAGHDDLDMAALIKVFQ